MKALVLKEIKSPVVFEETASPSPGEGEVLVQLKAAALNRRDYWITQGMYPGIECPVILGSDGVGVVASVGGGVDQSWVGKEVIINPGYCWGESQGAQGPDFKILGLPDDGTFAEEIVVPVEQLHEKPAYLDKEQAAALPLAALTAYRAVFVRGRFAKGQKVLITGAGGGVATFAVQFAVAAGATAFVTSSSAEKIEKAMSLGASGGFDYTDEGWVSQFQSGHGLVDLIVDGAGGAGYAGMIDILAPGGRLVHYGATTGNPGRINLRKVYWKQLNLLGSTMGSPEDFKAMLKFVSEHEIKPVVDRVYHLSQGNEAIEQMGASSQFGKIVLSICE